MKKFIFSILICFLIIPIVFADSKNDNLVNVYLFYSDSCSYCSKERKLFNELKEKYDNLNVFEYNVDKNMELFEEVSDLYNTKVTGVPCVFIGDKVYKGYSYTESKRKLMAVIDYYSNYGYKDIVGEYVLNEMLSRNDIDNNIDIDEYISNYGNYKISILGKIVNTDDISLSIMSILTGIVDGIDILMFILVLVLFSVIILNKRKIEMWVLLVSGLLGMSITCLINLFGILEVNLNIIHFILVFLLLFLGGFRLISYFSKKDIGGKLLCKNRFLLELICVILISFLGMCLLNGKGSLFLDVISLYDLIFIEKFIYVFIYMLFYMIIYFIILYILMFIVQKRNLNIKYNNLLLLVSGGWLVFVGLFDLIYKLC